MSYLATALLNTRYIRDMWTAESYQYWDDECRRIANFIIQFA